MTIRELLVFWGSPTTHASLCIIYTLVVNRFCLTWLLHTPASEMTYIVSKWPTNCVGWDVKLYSLSLTPTNAIIAYSARPHTVAGLKGVSFKGKESSRGDGKRGKGIATPFWNGKHASVYVCGPCCLSGIVRWLSGPTWKMVARHRQLWNPVRHRRKISTVEDDGWWQWMTTSESQIQSSSCACTGWHRNLWATFWLSLHSQWNMHNFIALTVSEWVSRV